MLGRSKYFGITLLVLASLVSAGTVAAQATAGSVRTTDAGQIAGETVLIVGQGFGVHESVDLEVVHAGGLAEPGMGHGPWTVITGPDGKFVTTWIINASDAAGDAFVVTAHGGLSGVASTAAFERMAAVGTDKFHYLPGENAAIEGVGFVAGEGVTLQVVHAGGLIDAGPGHDPWTVTADAYGAITSTMPIVGGDPFSSEYVLRAKGADSGLAAASALSALVCPPTPPPDAVVPFDMPTATCPPNLNSCTANDVVTSVVSAEPLGGDVCGTLSDELSLQFTVKFETTANERYDLGVFVSADGGTLNNGSGNTPPTADACVGVAPQVGDGDGNADTSDCDSDHFLDVDPTGHAPNQNAVDTCGDLQQNAGPVFLTVTATVSCSTIDANHHLKVPSCRVWEQNANHQVACTTLSQAGTGSKCDCTPLDFTQVLNPCVTALCDDENVCTTDTCAVEGGVAVCHHTAVDDGTSCDDGTVCNGHEACVGGTCTPGTALDCDDDNPCTDDSCDPVTGCHHVNNTDPCDDGNACTTNDVCGGGSCNGGSAPNCNDNNPCTVDSCNPATGCVNDPGGANGNPCDDGNACTGVIGNGDVCNDGGCQPGGTVDCNDNNPCTDDSCNPATGCVNTNNTAPCSDGNACTTNDVCAGGSCQGGPAPNCDDSNVCTTDGCNPATGCTHTNNSNPCSDGNVCTTGDVCSGGSCHGGPPPNCDDSNPCTDDACDPAAPPTSGPPGCTHTNNSNPCSDGNACTTGDFCGGGFCQGGPAPNCDDGNPCTDDACNPATGCTHTNNSNPCSDGNACTTNDVCAGGSCQGGPAPNCDDSNVCTTDGCNPATGCTHTNNSNPCSDGNVCTTGDVCSGGSCHGGPPPNCDDSNPCTDDACDPAAPPTSGPPGCTHTNNSNPCSDGNACTTGDFCGGGFCQGGPAPNCDDGNPCTDDACNPATGCTHTNNANPCSDGNACTTGDVCGGGSCQPGGPVNCNDNNPCTDDSCNPATGCVNTNNTAPCSDGNACTTNDTCGGGSCQGGPAPNCDDGNVCTDDSCNPATGCVHTNNTAPCNDDNSCTTGDACSGGTCVGGGAANCDDGNVCTDDSCNAMAGAKTQGYYKSVCDGHHPNDHLADYIDCVNNSATFSGVTTVAQLCDRLNPNPSNDKCEQAEAQFMTLLLNICEGRSSTSQTFTSDCDDTHATVGDVVTHSDDLLSDPSRDFAACEHAQCEDDAINNSDETGSGVVGGAACSHTNNTGPCDDGNACTTGDVCGGGNCNGGPPPNCDDGNVCTIDSCNPATGCVNDPGGANGNPCEDGNACTGVIGNGDVCNDGGCQPGGTVDCNDNNPCTDDSCNPATGCVHTNNTAPCSDGNACTTNDVCGGGSCNSGPPLNCDDSNPCTDDSCNPATGCVHKDNTNPCDDGNACTTNDTCGSGSCHGGAPPNCNDNNPCTTDSCNPATGCVNTSNDLCHANPKTQGFWRRLCAGPHPEGSITQADVDCVSANSCTFASVHTLADLCSRLNPDPANDKCEQGESQLMATMLNYCQDRLSDISPIISTCTNHTTAGQNRAEADALLCDPTRTAGTCTLAQCEADELNTGTALQTNSLRISRLANGSLRLTWDPPYGNSDFGPPTSYTLRRRASTNLPYETITNTPNLFFVDAGAVGSAYFEYEVIPVW